MCLALFKFTGEVKVSRSFSLADVPLWLTGKKRIIQYQAVSARKGSLNKFTSRMAGWSETFTELTGKNGPCHDCLRLQVQVLPTAL